LDLDLRKKLVKCYILSICLYDPENWKLWEVDQKYLESFEISCWRRMQKVGWTDRVNNIIWSQAGIITLQEGRLNGLVTSCVEIVFSNTLLNEIYNEG